MFLSASENVCVTLVEVNQDKYLHQININMHDG